MSKSGQARVPTDEQQERLFDVIRQHRHPEKNTAIMQISFKLGLRAQEIALLQIKEIAQLNAKGNEFKLLEVMSLPAAYTKGANALNRSHPKYDRRTVSMKVEEYSQNLRKAYELGKAQAHLEIDDFLPPVRTHRGRSRDLPMVDKVLRTTLEDYLTLRLEKQRTLKPSDSLFITQKGGPYSPNTLQEHMGLMLRDWAGIEKASSHSGRRALATNIIHKQEKSVKVARKILGHANAATTLIYEDPPEEKIADALENL